MGLRCLINPLGMGQKSIDIDIDIDIDPLLSYVILMGIYVLLTIERKLTMRILANWYRKLLNIEGNQKLRISGILL